MQNDQIKFFLPEFLHSLVAQCVDTNTSRVLVDRVHSGVHAVVEGVRHIFEYLDAGHEDHPDTRMPLICLVARDVRHLYEEEKFSDVEIM